MKSAAADQKNIETKKLAAEQTSASSVSQSKTDVAEKVPPKAFFPIPGGESAVEKSASASAAAEKSSAKETVPAERYASLPPDVSMPEDIAPTAEEMAKPPKSLMNYVDIVFEVKDKKAILYQNPDAGEPTGVVLAEGSKGKANLEVVIGEDRWYQVKTKQGNGWTKGSALSTFNLSPAAAVPVTEEVKSEKAVTTFEKPLDGERQESTYFEAGSGEVPIYTKPGSKKQAGTLSEDVAYLAVKSEKSGDDRWFLLQIRSGETAWVRGRDLRLANVQQPAQMKIPTQEMSLRDQKSAFTAEWVVAGVKGVGVYSRPSIAGDMIQQISPPVKYRVLELAAGGGKEWYRIQIPGKGDGWVQSLDVSLTQPNKP